MSKSQKKKIFEYIFTGTAIQAAKETEQYIFNCNSKSKQDNVVDL